MNGDFDYRKSRMREGLETSGFIAAALRAAATIATNGVLDLSALALELGLPIRTMQRKLDRWCWSYRDLRETALVYLTLKLAKEGKSMDEVGEALDFARGAFPRFLRRSARFRFRDVRKRFQEGEELIDDVVAWAATR